MYDHGDGNDGDDDAADPLHSGPFREALPGAPGRLGALDIETETGSPESLSLPRFFRRRGRRGDPR